MKSLPEIGDVVDDTYELISVLGTGGFGAVYRARQLNMDRDVALKLLIASGPKWDEMVKRFRREVMAIRNLTHPNTVRIFDFRDHPDGLLYYTMEALEGVTLKQELKREGPFAPRRFKRIMLQVLKSLSEAHSYSIIHRDLKPANIMLVEMHGEEDFVKVLDFGIAKLMQDGNEEDEEVEELTSAGMLVGTLKYMAPEQIAGEQLGSHTDLYALGLIAVEMLTGESIYSGSGRWEVLRQQVSEEPVDIPQPVLDSHLGPVIRRCLDKDRRRRYATADDVIADLKALNDAELAQQPLYVSDGQGGWVPQGGNASPPPKQKETVEYDELPTMMLDDDALEPLDEAKTTVTPAPGPSDQGASPGSGDFPSVPGTTDTSDSSGSPSPPSIPPPGPTEKNPAVSPPGPTTKNPAVSPPGPTAKNSSTSSRPQTVDSTGEMPSDAPAGGESPELDRQHAELRANQLHSPTGEWDNKQSGNKTKVIAGVAILAIVGVGGILGALAMGGDDDDPETDDALAVQQQGDTAEDDAEPEPDDDAEDVDEVERHEIHVDVDDDAVTATVYLDDEPLGDTPQIVEFETEAILRLEADDFEPFEGLVDGETSPELVVEMEPVDDEPEPVAERETGQRPSGSTGSAPPSTGATGAQGGARPDPGSGGSEPSQEATPPEEPEESAVDEEEEDVDEEPEEEEDSGWVDIAGDDPEPEVDDDDLPLF